MLAWGTTSNTSATVCPFLGLLRDRARSARHGSRRLRRRAPLVNVVPIRASGGRRSTVAEGVEPVNVAGSDASLVSNSGVTLAFLVEQRRKQKMQCTSVCAFRHARR